MIQPRIEELKKNKDNRIKNHHLYHKITNKEKIEENEIIAHEGIEGDGNCFFRNISFFLLIIKTIMTFLDKYCIYISIIIKMKFIKNVPFIYIKIF